MTRCGLCNELADLRESHLLPKALYRLLRVDDRQNPNPVVVRPSRAVVTSKQVSDKFLCGVCEQRFCDGGERYVLGNCYRQQQGFGFRTALLEQGRRAPENEIEFYLLNGSMGSEIDQCLYFSASVFWRAAAHQWYIDGYELERTSLGPYEEEYRQYLLGKAQFPQKSALCLVVSSESDPDNICIPPAMHEHQQCMRHKFYIPGMLFVLFVGDELPEMSRELSLVGPPRSVALAPGRRDEWLWSHIEMAAKSKLVSKKKRPR